MIASDFDDTLAREGKIDPVALERIRDVRRNGLAVVIVTGRRMSELLEVFDEIHEVDFVVSENGGYAFVPGTDEGWPLTHEVDESLVAELERGGVTPLQIGETIIGTLAPCLDVVTGILESHGSGYVVIRNRESLMLLPRGVDKGSGLEAALRHLGFQRGEAVAVGDAENDVVFLAGAGLGVAVGDATKGLKDVADVVTAAPGPQGFVELMDGLAADGWMHDPRPPRSQATAVEGQARAS